MKQIIILTLTLFSVLACDFDRLHPPERFSLGTLTAKMNGKEWHKTYKNAYQVVVCFLAPYSTMLPCKSDILEIMSELYSPEGYLRQQLYITKIPKGKGRYPILPLIAEHCDETELAAYGNLNTIVDDGDVVAEIYTALDAAENYIQIDKYNPDTGEIKGTFQMTLIVNFRGQASGLPDTLRFIEGRFDSKIQDHNHW